MLKKTITYKTFDGEEVTEDFYFNFTKAEIVEMQLRHDGGFEAYLNQVVKSKDGQQIMDTFKKIILDSVGRRSEDGKRFIKNDEIRDEFYQSDAYSELFIKLVTNAGEAEKFANGIVPRALVEEVIKELESGEPSEDGKDEPEQPAWIREDREPTQKELASMSKEELQEAFRRKAQK